jgi:hypothetical protein
MARYYADHAATSQTSDKKSPRGAESSMRFITALAGALLACALPPDAMAATDGSSAGPGGESLVIGSAGVFALLDDEFDYPLLLGLQYRAAPRTGWLLRPGVGILAGEDRIGYLYVDLARDFTLSRQWFATLSLGFGWFNNGDGIEVVDAREFQTVVAVSRRLRGGARIGLSGSHISNGGLSSPNRGTETLALFFALPVRPLR